jgi:hypothetical protein
MEKYNMKVFEVGIESISPMLHHGSQNVGMEKESLKKKGGIALMGDPEEWKKTIYFDEEIGVYMPAISLEASFVNAAKQFKISGRTTATKYFKSGVFIMDEKLDFTVNGKKIKSLDEVEVDKRTVKNPSTKGRNVRYRAIFKKWQSHFKVLLSADDFISNELLKEVIEFAGMYIGVGDYRPRFGRYKITSFKEVK